MYMYTYQNRGSNRTAKTLDRNGATVPLRTRQCPAFRLDQCPTNSRSTEDGEKEDERTESFDE